MLEGFAAWLLNTYIGDYFGNVNTDQLRMSLHSGTCVLLWCKRTPVLTYFTTFELGEIELERLPLKRDLLKHLGLPLEASTGERERLLFLHTSKTLTDFLLMCFCLFVGYIGKISIKFPRWHLFTSEPLVITIDELYLLVRPITNFTVNCQLTY